MRYLKLAIIVAVGAFALAPTAALAADEPFPVSIEGEPAGSVQGELAPATESDFAVSNGSDYAEAAPLKADAMTSAEAAATRTNNRSKPILFVHGLDALGEPSNNCNASFGVMRTALKSYGWSARTHDIGYYYGDVDCGSQIDMLSSHSKHYPSGHACCNARGYTSHTADTDIRHLGYHLAWWIYHNYSKYGQRVDIVGHSMGGLITRYAIQRSGRHADFPPYILVEDVVTLGTPHTGGKGTWACSGYKLQCSQLAGGSSFLSWMAANAKNPQASGGTDWTAIGSDNDNYVSAGSATGMDASHRVRYTHAMGIEHSEYMHDTMTAWTRDVSYWDRGFASYKSWYSAPAAVPWADQALAYGSW